jgi:hypothetical protein
MVVAPEIEYHHLLQCISALAQGRSSSAVPSPLPNEQVHGRQPILWIEPEPNYSWFGRIQLKQDPNRGFAVMYAVWQHDLSVSFAKLANVLRIAGQKG